MNIYISGLDATVTNDSLNSLFATYGQVNSARIMIDGFTGYSRGFGFVEMPNNDEAATAITAINGSVLEGRQVSVKESLPATEHRGSYPVGVRSRK